MSGTSPSLLSGRLPAVDQFPTVFKRHDLLFGARGVPPILHMIITGSLGRAADSTHDHHRVTGASLRPPGHWRRPCGRPRTSWLREIDTDVQSTSGSTQPGKGQWSHALTIYHRHGNTLSWHRPVATLKTKGATCCIRPLDSSSGSELDETSGRLNIYACDFLRQHNISSTVDVLLDTTVT